MKVHSPFHYLALHLATWIGSPQSLVIHTIFFIVIFGLVFFGVPFDTMLLALTTAVSLEAIYLAIFIQMTVNQTTKSLQAVEEDIDEIQEDVDEIQKDVDEIQEDVDEIEKDDQEDEHRDLHNKQVLEKIEQQLHNLIGEINRIKKQQ